MPIYRSDFRFLLKIAKCFVPKVKIEGMQNVQTPAVYIGRHLNNYGPIAMYAHMPFEFHLWSYFVFTDREECYRHYANFTFVKRLRMKPKMASFCARLATSPTMWLYRAIHCIPVYRGRKTIMKTFDLTVDALERNENALILDDVNYTNEGAEVGQLYTGFVYIAKLYYKRTGKSLSFVPVSVKRAEKTLKFGSPIAFSPDQPYHAERDRIVQQLTEALADSY